MPPSLGLRGGGFGLHHSLNLYRYVVEEVVFEYYRDSPQQFCVDGAPAEYIIYIHPMTVQLSGKPRHGVFLRVLTQDFLDFIADVHAAWWVARLI